jgi:putative membrane protein
MMHWDGYGWGWIMLMPVLWVALIAVIVWAVVKLVQHPADGGAEQPRRETPLEILDRRFASGEIDAEAYRQARDTLAGKEPRSS